MGFGRFIGGVALILISIFLAFLGFVVLLGFLDSFVKSFSLPVGIGVLVLAALLFAYGWYSFKSAEPKGTFNTRNVDEQKKQRSQ